MERPSGRSFSWEEIEMENSEAWEHLSEPLKEKLKENIGKFFEGVDCEVKGDVEFSEEEYKEISEKLFSDPIYSGILLAMVIW